MADYKQKIKELLFFKEPEKKEEFILKESAHDKKNMENKSAGKRKVCRKKKNAGFLGRLFKPNSEKKDECGGDEPEEKDVAAEDENKSKISKKLSDNLQHMKKIYNVPVNGDVIIREFEIRIKERSVSAFVIFIDGMVDRNVINMAILQPLMVLSELDSKAKDKDVISYISSYILPDNQVAKATEYDAVIDMINFGGCGIFVDGADGAFAADVKGWEHRTVERPNTEMVIRGPQEGFVEILRINTALVRKILKDENLIVENLEIGKRSKTPCSIMYIKGITNDSLVEEVRRRLKRIKIDYLIDSGELEQLIEDDPYLPAPQILSTERPDRVASMLAEGKVSVFVHGSPFALIMPITNSDLIHSPEDSYVRFPYANMLRIIRIVAVLLSLLLPGTYLAITNFHHEMIPTDLLLAIEASREKVPFPSVVEILLMEISFELIREAGIRIPGPIGPTLGIIGALILGQAAVAANIVSPILIIVVAVTGIGSFAIPNFSLAFAYRLLRFAYIILGSLAGFLGITTGLFIQGIWLVNAKSFGVPFLAPYGPKTGSMFADQLLRWPTWMQEERPDYVNAKVKKKQPEISRGWVEKQEKEEDKNEK